VIDIDASTAPYIPTPEEIEAQCRRIRASWSEEEKLRRASTTRPGKFCKRVFRCHLPAQEMEAVA